MLNVKITASATVQLTQGQYDDMRNAKNDPSSAAAKFAFELLVDTFKSVGYYQQEVDAVIASSTAETTVRSASEGLTPSEPLKPAENESNEAASPASNQ